MEINMLGVLIASVAAMAWGAFYYSPAGAGNAWMKEMGKTAKDLEAAKKEMPKLYALNFLFTIVMAYVFAHVLRTYGAMTVSAGLEGAFWMWLGFIATLTAGGVLWNGKTWKGWFIDNVYWLVSLGIMSVILVSIG